MAKQTRVDKYRKLRRDIDKMNEKSFEQLLKEDDEKKKNIVKDSIRHASKNEMNCDIKTATLTISIEELLEGHAKYIGEEEKKKEELKKKRKRQLTVVGIGLLALALIIVIIIVIVCLTK